MPVNRCDQCHEIVGAGGACLCFERPPIYTATLVPPPPYSTSTTKIWEVTGGQEVYVVKLDEAGAWQCSCPDHRFRRRRCKHIDTADEALDASEVDPAAAS